MGALTPHSFLFFFSNLFPLFSFISHISLIAFEMKAAFAEQSEKKINTLFTIYSPPNGTHSQPHCVFDGNVHFQFIFNVFMTKQINFSIFKVEFVVRFFCFANFVFEHSLRTVDCD